MNAAAIVRAAGGSVLLLLGLAACDNMQHQENVRAFEPSVHFANGASARTPPAHTVARGDPGPDDPLASGGRPGAWAVDFPLPLTRGLVERGRERYAIFCADCHGEDGAGDGIIVRRGFPAPVSLHEPRLRQEPVGSLFADITRGSGRMDGFADRIEPRDRWAIVAYIRALQKSRDSTLAELSAAERRLLPP